MWKKRGQAVLTEDQTKELWYEMFEAEARSLYFADLGHRYTRRKQIITGASFFLSSGAAATVLAHAPTWVPVVLACVTAILTAYSIAVGLDQKAATMAKLHYNWSQIEDERRRIWAKWYEDDAELKLREVEARAADASQTAVTEAPYNEDLLNKWASFVYKQHHVATA